MYIGNYGCICADRYIDMDTDVHIDMMQMYIDKPCKVSMAFLFEKEKISE